MIALRILLALATATLLLAAALPPDGVAYAARPDVPVSATSDRGGSLVRRVLPVPGGVSPDPQFELARLPAREVVVRDASSGRLVSTRFLPNRRQARVERAVALTFDDGPSPPYTDRILATLERLHVQATFFVIGALADRYPGIVRAELHAGMTVGNHTYDHPQTPPFDAQPARAVRGEIARGANSLRRLGDHPTLFRPPGGHLSPRIVRAAARFGERVVLWSVDPRDWQPGATAAQIADRVLAAVRPGSIVVLHDGGGNRAATAAALPTIIHGIRDRGLPLVAIPPR